MAIRTTLSMDLEQLKGQDIIDLADEIKKRQGEQDPIRVEVTPQEWERGPVGGTSYKVTLHHEGTHGYGKRPKPSEFGSLAGGDRQS
ncbi:hypothetical protein KHO57_gp066 [Mycobacterium phage Phabba]|uniref:Uncharacterized protein n=1 Tax=Mycobacterium phage Phabba TaxID=2027899 RepID=A0A249XSD3_9CAUD|nr:hypothetical protein KHO57_gp066 [Mycobacterium phage Phabba]ASZ74641.1 hypothetical protein SEA_PHABBA_66 [Mycobacterium phage Phabba]